MPRPTSSRLSRLHGHTSTLPRAGFSVHACVGPRLVSAAGLLFACTPARAADLADGLTPDKYTLLNVVAGLSFLTLVLGLILLVLNLIRAVRPNPALHEQFAAKNHTHPEFLTRSECKDLMHQSAAGDREILARLESLDKKVSDGMSRAHARIDPLAEAVAATAKLLDHHLNDHRSSPKG